MKIKIGNLEWTVLRAAAHEPVLVVDGLECTGTTWLGKAEIYIDETLQGSRAMRTLVHELCHAYIFSTQAIRPETWDEEAICDFVAVYALEITKLASEVFNVLYSSSEVDK